MSDKIRHQLLQLELQVGFGMDEEVSYATATAILAEEITVVGNNALQRVIPHEKYREEEHEL